MTKKTKKKLTIDEAKKVLAKAQNIAVLSGAGLSTESGIPDFRSSGGLYENPLTMLVFWVKGFQMFPGRFYRTVGPLYKKVVSVKPNAGHLALAELERQGKHVEIVTQNVDCLHQRAGSTIVHEIHGTIDTLSCLHCGCKVKASKYKELFMAGEVPLCPDCGKALKPDFVFFGENLPKEALSNAEQAFRNADLVLILGTSLKVSPANTLPAMRKKGSPLFIINHASTQYDDCADFVSHETIGSILPQLVGVA